MGLAQMRFDAYDLLLMSEAESEGMVQRETTFRLTWEKCREFCRQSMTTDAELKQEAILNRYLGEPR